MGLIVMKFGGTSVANIDKIKDVAKKVSAKRSEGNSVVVVVSAMSGVTDKLIDNIKSIDERYSLREYDQIVSTGETSNAPLLVQALLSNNVDAISLTGRQAGIETDRSYGKSRIKKINTRRISDALSKGKVCVVAGFQGYNPESDDTTTLGRGGSDTTAVALAAALKASVCEIYTDVDGVYTADPRVVKDAKKLYNISHEEMLELSSLGAKVLASRCLEFGMNYNVDIMVLSSTGSNSGTLVTSKLENSMEKVVVSGVTSDKNQARITLRNLPDKLGVAAEIFTDLAEANINVDMIVQNFGQKGLANISFTVSKTDLGRSLDACKALKDKYSDIIIDTDETVSKISLVGVGMKSHSGVAAKMFKVLADHKINILMISTSEIKISCLIDEKLTDDSVRALHNAFIGGIDQVE